MNELKRIKILHIHEITNYPYKKLTYEVDCLPKL